MKLKFLENMINSYKKEKVKKFYHKLLEGDPEDISSNIEKLGKINHPLVLYASVMLLTHKYPEVREWAIDEIGSRKELMKNPKIRKEVYEKLIEFLNSKEDYVSEAAMKVFETLSDGSLGESKIRKVK